MQEDQQAEKSASDVEMKTDKKKKRSKPNKEKKNKKEKTVVQRVRSSEMSSS